MTDDPLAPWRDAYAFHKEQALRDFFHFLSFPSISADAAYAPQVQECAKWLRDTLSHHRKWNRPYQRVNQSFLPFIICCNTSSLNG